MLLDLIDDLDRQAPDHERDLCLVGPSIPLPAGWTLRPQGTGDLGARIARAVGRAAEAGAGRVVVLGSDAPLLPDGLLADAFRALETEELTLAPAEDGGFVLIGFARSALDAERIRRLLRRVRWGTGDALRDTLQAAGDAGLRAGLLRSHWDVDRPEDVDRLRRLAARFPERLPRVRNLLGDQRQTASSIACPRSATPL